MSVTSLATELRKAAPLGVTASERSMAQTFARRSGALGPVIRTSARPCVASKTLTSPSSCTSSTRCVTVALVPGAASNSHSPGPEPTTSVSYASRAARPNGTPRARDSSPSVDASTRTLARGVQSVIFSSAALRRALTSQPCSTVVGGTCAIGLRATGAVSTTLARPFWVVVRVVRRDGGRYALSAVRLQADEPRAAFVLTLPHQLGLAREVVLVQPDHPPEAYIVGSREPVGVLAHDEVSLLQAQDALRFYAERSYAEIR